MKTMMRQRAYPKDNSKLAWAGYPTKRGAPVDSLFEANCQIVEAWLGDLMSSSAAERSSTER